MINVLMVDNDLSCQEEVKQYFSNRNSINLKKTFMDSQKALDELLANPLDYDVVLMDPVISPIDGIEFLKKLRESNSSIKVIVYTNHNNINMINNLYLYNIAFFLLKIWGSQMHSLLLEISM